MQYDRLPSTWKFVVAGLSALALTVAVTCASSAAGKGSNAVVKVTAAASKADSAGKQTVTVNIEIEKGYHIYANPVKNEDLTSIQTVVKIKSQNKLADVKVQYPPGNLHKVKEESWMQYEGKVTIEAVVLRAAGDNGPLEVEVRFSACNEMSCLPPGTQRFTLP